MSIKGKPRSNEVDRPREKQQGQKEKRRKNSSNEMVLISCNGIEYQKLLVESVMKERERMNSQLTWVESQ